MRPRRPEQPKGGSSIALVVVGVAVVGVVAFLLGQGARPEVPAQPVGEAARHEDTPTPAPVSSPADWPENCIRAEASKRVEYVFDVFGKTGLDETDRPQAVEFFDKDVRLSFQQITRVLPNALKADYPQRFPEGAKNLAFTLAEDRPASARRFMEWRALRAAKK